MADKNRYPQIPSTVWWGVRSIIQRTPTATIDERLLGVQLGVQEVAARAYVGELRSVGILSDEGKTTPLAQKWRLDDSYPEAVEQLIQANYPEGLIQVAPPGEAERQKVVSWFLREGLGQGAAGNKAATYLLLSSPSPNEPPRSSPKGSMGDTGQRPASRKPPSVTPKVEKNAPSTHTQSGTSRQQAQSGRSVLDTLPLNVNVQIHISADAGSEQIESIFRAMRRYLHDDPST